MSTGPKRSIEPSDILPRAEYLALRAERRREVTAL